MKDISQIKDQTFIENDANDEYEFPKKKEKQTTNLKKIRKQARKKSFKN